MRHRCKGVPNASAARDIRQLQRCSIGVSLNFHFCGTHAFFTGPRGPHALQQEWAAGRFRGPPHQHICNFDKNHQKVSTKSPKSHQHLAKSNKINTKNATNIVRQSTVLNMCLLISVPPIDSSKLLMGDNIYRLLYQIHKYYTI